MVLLVLGSAIILMVIWAGLHNRISLYSPLMLSALVWQVVFIIGLVFGARFYQVTERAFAMWLVWFLVSSLFYFFLSNQPQASKEIELRRLPIDYTIVLVGLILSLAYQIRVVGNAGPAQFFANLRLSSNDTAGLESLGIFGRFHPWVFALFLFEHLNARDENRRLRLLLWCLMLLYAFATMGKLALLTPVVAWAVIRGLRGTLPMRGMLVLAPLVLGLMVLFHLVRDLTGEQFVFANFLSVYVYSPLVALGYMETPIDAPLGAHTFRFVYAVVHAAVGGMEPVHVVQNYVAVPHLTNVYTVIQPFALDFGMPGVFFGSTFYGLFFGLAFHRARAQRQLAMIIYAGLSVVLVSQFIGEFLFTMFSGQLQFIIAAIVFTSQSRRVDLVR